MYLLCSLSVVLRWLPHYVKKKQQQNSLRRRRRLAPPPDHFFAFSSAADKNSMDAELMQ